MKIKYLVAAVVAAIPGIASAQDFDGARIEARLGYETPTVSDDGDVYKIGSAVSYGGEVGYDFKVSEKVAVGPYANYEFSSVDLCDGGDCLEEKGNLSVGGRVAFVVSPKVAIYGKLGYARIGFRIRSGALSASDSKSGVQGGLGVEFAIAKQFYGFVDGNYADYGKFYGINLQRRQVAAGVGIRF